MQALVSWESTKGSHRIYYQTFPIKIHFEFDVVFTFIFFSTFSVSWSHTYDSRYVGKGKINTWSFSIIIDFKDFFLSYSF